LHPGKTDIEAVLAAIGREQAPEGLHERIMRACGSVETVAEITCEECLELASAYIDDELSPAERDLFEGHVFICAACYRTFRRMQRASDVLRETPAAVAPAGLDARIKAAVAREAAAEPAPNFAWRRTAAVLGGLAAAAALLAAVFIPRGGDGLSAGDTLIAETPAESVGSIADALDAEEPAAAAEAPEMAESAVADAAAAATAQEPTVGSSARVAASRETPRPRRVAPTMVADNGPAPAPVREDAAPRHELRLEQPAPVRPQPERSTRPRETDRPAPVIAPAPRPAPRPQPVIAEQPPTPAPAAPATAVSTPAPPAHTVPPRDTSVAALPPQPAPAPVSTPPATAPSAASPRPAGGEPVAVRTAARGGSPSRVIPTQPRSRTVFQSEEAPAGELRSRMAGRINGSVSSLDRTTSGIQLN
jgi:hypothetical protein